MDFELKTWVARMLKNITASVEGAAGGPPRSSRYDELIVLPGMSKKYGTVTSGEYRIASMTPSGTALQLGLSAAFSATAPAILLYNGENKADPLGKRCYVDFIRMVVGGAPTSATAWWGALFVDDRDRTPTNVVAEGGTAATLTCYTPPVFDPNMGSSPVIVGKPYFPLSTSAGAPPVVGAAGTSVRRLCGNIPFRATQIPVVGDEYYLDFGPVDAPTGYVATAAPAGLSKLVIPVPGVCLDASQWMLLHMWGPSNATAGITFSAMDIGWWER